MYCILKMGVYCQGVWATNTLGEAENIRDKLISEDCDDYHLYCIVEGDTECDILLLDEVVEGKRKIPKQYYYSRCYREGTVYATEKVPTMEGITGDIEKAYLHDGEHGYQRDKSINNFWIVPVWN